MAEYSIRSKCQINTNRDTDTFVGIKCDSGEISIHFPLGFHISDDDNELRKDIMLLINTIASSTGKKESELIQADTESTDSGFPMQAYLGVIYDFFERGYYKERETEYTISKRGKINWARTIKTIKPLIQDNNVYYLDFVTKKNSIKENELITLIHEYCVYDSFEKIGWLFTSMIPSKPRIKLAKYFSEAIKEKLSHTFNDRNKVLFKNMIHILDYECDRNADHDFYFGTNRFEYVWESMIDRVFGIEGKSDYFPKTTWKLHGRKHDNASLEPDSIMLFGNDVYVLDAKYYKYGQTGYLTDLPESTSINKQITYGEYVKKYSGCEGTVYNAFLLPFDASLWSRPEFFPIGDATGNWRDNVEVYEHVQGILVDVKYLMQKNVREDYHEILKLAECIQKSVEESMNG